jgi:hypothetical protein
VSIALPIAAVLASSAAALCACDRSSPAAQREPASSTTATSSPASAPAPSPSSSAPGARLAAGDLCVTSGALRTADGLLAVEAPEFRAVATRSGDMDVELRFTYLGPTPEVAHLGSGRVRGQIGLKLRAKDPCNLVYAMWRIDPGPELVVQVKRNAGERTSAECKNRGYRTVRPLRSTPVGPVTPGSSHVMRATMTGASLGVWADGALVWEGALGDDVLDLEGPIGLRSDNARLTFALSASGGDGRPRPCGAPEGE